MKWRLGVKSIVTEKFERSTVKLVGAAFADNVDLIGTKAIFSRVGFALHFEFLDRILRQDDGRGVQSGVRIDQPVQGVIVGGRPAAIDADGVSFSLPHLALLARSLHGASANEQQVQKVAAIERQLLHLLLADQL